MVKKVFFKYLVFQYYLLIDAFSYVFILILLVDIAKFMKSFHLYRFLRFSSTRNDIQRPPSTIHH